MSWYLELLLQTQFLTQMSSCRFKDMKLFIIHLPVYVLACGAKRNIDLLYTDNFIIIIDIYSCSMASN